MALINTLRNKGGKVVVFLIGFSIVAFIGADLFGPNSTILGNKLNVGEIADVTISYQDFIDKQDELTINFQQNQRRSPSSDEQEYIKNQTWDALVNLYAYSQQYDALGLAISDDELVDMFQGDNINPQVSQAFTDPNTGAFDKESVINYIASLAEQSPEQRSSWVGFEKSIMDSRLREKFNNLVVKTNYATQAEAKYQYTNSNNTAEVNYIFVPFDDVADSDVTFTDAELETYLSSHTDEYESKESKTLKYVVYDIKPSVEDSTLVRNQAMELAKEFMNAEDDSLYATVNSDGSTPILTYTESQLPSNLLNAEIGTVVGPSVEENSYVLYKVSSKEDSTYTVAKVEVEIYVTDDTRNIVYRDAEQLALASTDVASLETNANANGLAVKTASNIDKNAKAISGVSQARSIVFWAYNEAELGSVSEVYEINDKYIIAGLVSEKEEAVDLASVKNEVERKVINKKKAKLIIDKLNAIDETVLATKVLSYDANIAKYHTMSDLKLSSNSLTGVVGLALEAIGVTFSMEPGEITDPFAIDNGVIMIELVNKYDAPEVSDYELYRTQVTSKRQSSASYYGIDQAVKELADITDDRYKFF